MTKTVSISLALLIGFIASFVLNWPVLAEENHPRGMQCQDCHLAPQVTKANAHQLIANQEQLCISCHATAMQVSHPSGITPSMKVPANLPLDWKGDVSCSTCHFIHGNDAGHLRVQKKGGRKFCLQCHEQAFFSAMVDQGASIQRSGHLATSILAASVDLDPFSRQCLTCHMDNDDGTALSIDSRGIVRHGKGRANHPIGMSYDQFTSFGAYRRQADLRREIMLPDGRVGCVSCHQGYSKEHGALVMSNNRSALCMECHDL